MSGPAVYVPDPDDPEPWIRARGESGKAHAAFIAYRDLGPGRSVNSLAPVIGKSRALLFRWKNRWGWEPRVEAWDRHLEQARQRAWEKAATAHPDEIALMNARHAQMAQGLQQKALLRLAQLDPSQLTPPQVLSYLVEAVKIERLARGEAKDDTSEGDVADQDTVVRLLADPDSRRLASQLAARAGRHDGNGKG